MKHERIVERVYRRLLREGLGDGLAAYVMRFGNSSSAVVYDTDVALETFDGDDDEYDMSCIVGYVGLLKPRGAPCRDAWMVNAIAGPGRLVYGMAYALSPNGLVVPDRSIVSPSAKDAWRKYAKDAEARGAAFPLDDADHPTKGQSAYHDAHHTPDPSDDCYTSHEEDYLNAAYAGRGEEAAMLRRLEAAHDKIVSRMDPDTRIKFEAWIWDLGHNFVDSKISPDE